MTERARVAALALLAAATGCFGGRLPPLQYYRLSTADSAMVANEVATRSGRAIAALPALAVAPFEAPGIYGRRQISYRIDDTGYGAYPSRQWAVPLSVMVGLITEDVLRAHPLSAEPAVFDPPSYAGYPYVWRGRIRELEEVDRGDRVYAAVRLDARLVRTTDDSVLWSGSTRLERAVVDAGRMESVVAVLSDLTTRAIEELVGDARGALARSAASTAPR